MRTNLNRIGLSLVFGSALFSLYIIFLAFFAPVLVAPQDELELVIFYTLLLRVVLLTAVPLFRRIHPQIKIGLVSIESFVLVLFIAMFTLTHDFAYSTIMGEILTTWIGASLVILTPYGIVEFIITVYKGSTITTVFTSLAPLFAVGVFLANFAQTSSPQTSIASFGNSVVDSLRVQPALGNITTSSVSIIGVATIMIFVGGLLYVLADQPFLSSFPAKRHLSIVLMLISTAILGAWTFVFLGFTSNVLLVLSLPSMVIPIALWWLSHGK